MGSLVTLILGSGNVYFSLKALVREETVYASVVIYNVQK